MNRILSMAVSFYKYLLFLFPKPYRVKFKDDMLLDFYELANDASEKGLLSLLGFFLRELRDFPVSLLHSYVEDVSMSNLFYSHPVKLGLRGALGLGIGFSVVSFMAWAGSVTFAVFDSIVQKMPNTIGDTDLFLALPLIVHLVISSLLFGFLFSFFLGTRTEFYKNAILIALCWFIPDTLSYMIVRWVYWNESMGLILGCFAYILTGTSLTFAFLIVNGSKDISTYLPITVLGGIGYLGLNRAVFYFAHQIFRQSLLPAGVGILPDVYIVPEYYQIAYKAVFGLAFGLFLGIIVGAQKKNLHLAN